MLLVSGDSKQMQFGNLATALSRTDTDLRLFGKPEVAGKRRLGVALAKDHSISEARAKANAVIADITVDL